MQDLEPPAMSVVVVSFNRTMQLLEECLRALEDQPIAKRMEIIVVRYGREDRENSERAVPLADRFPDVICVEASEGTIPHMRRLGVAQSRGSVVALIEDDCIVNADWAAAILRAHASPYAAVGGAVEPSAYRSAIDWAAFFCDYSRFMLPFDRGETWVLPGNNVSYKRAVVPELLAITEHDGLQEAFVHRRWHEDGKSMLADPQIVVRNEHRWRVADVVATPFFHGRAFGGQRARHWGAGRRFFFAWGAVLLPFVHVVRIAQRVLGRRREQRALMRAVPWIGVFGVLWAAGECVGYVAGPGDSLRRWR